MKFFKTKNKDSDQQEDEERGAPAPPEDTPPTSSDREVAPESERDSGETEEEAKPGFFGRLKQGLSRSPGSSDVETTPEEAAEATPQEPVAEAGEQAVPEVEPEAAPSKEGFFTRMKQGLSRTGSQFGEGMGKLLFGKKEIDEELLEDIESQLLMADVGIDTTSKIIDDLTERVARKQLADGDALYGALRESLRDILREVEKPLTIAPEQQPFVLLVVGVNGVGKTTTIGKLARRFQQQGKSVMLAAGDTFRAAAVEQLQVWGERNRVPVVAQASGSDSASVVYDAFQSAKARGTDILIADTAGRLHTKSHLMDELSKVKRVVGKLDSTAPHEILLVLDAGTGQNAMNQAEQFIDSVGVTGLALTKLDGTAKGGIIFALSDRFKVPIRYVGVGEGVDDLQTFEADTFVNALFATAPGEQSPGEQ